MRTRTAAAAIAALIVVMAIVSLWLYPALPATVPIHWGLSGEPDGWAPKATGLLFGPVVAALVLAMLFALPWLSPRSFAVESFRGTFNYVMVVMALLMGFVHGIILLAALRPEWDESRLLISGIFVFLALMGNVLGKVRRNFWMGIRTPWTLADDRVWDSTHRLAAHLLFGGGLLGALAVWLGAPPALCLIGLLVLALVPVLHSLVLSKRLERQDSA